MSGKEMSENSFWINIWTIFCVTAITLVSIAALHNYTVKAKAFENGYQLETIAGHDLPVWRKVK